MADPVDPGLYELTGGFECAAGFRGDESHSLGDGTVKKLLMQLVRDDRGQDLIEYGLLVGIITVAAVTAIIGIGPKVADYFGDLNTILPDAD
jgi:pilus assembly protein Flp/PilA